MTERELHADFFIQWQNEARLEVTNLTDAQLEKWRGEMAKIALCAKVKETIGAEEQRQRRASKVLASKPWLVGSDVNVSEIIANVKTRKERMTKEDKIVAMMKDLGVEGAEGIIKKVTDDKLKNFKIVKSDPSSDVVKNDEPFDFTKLDK